MNDKNTTPSVTLQTAILMQIREFSKQPTKPFSAHDITRAIRDKCNTGQIEIPEIEDLTGADTWRFQVNHKQVRNLFNQMRDNGVFAADYTIQQEFKGVYFEYTATPVISPASQFPPPPSPSPGPTTVQAVATLNQLSSGGATIDAEIERRVRQYLDNCKSRNFRPSLKHVQSAIKRGDKSTGVSSSDLLDFIRKNLGLTVSYGNGIDHTQVVL